MTDTGLGLDLRPLWFILFFLSLVSAAVLIFVTALLVRLLAFRRPAVVADGAATLPPPVETVAAEPKMSPPALAMAETAADDVGLAVPEASGEAVADATTVVAAEPEPTPAHPPAMAETAADDVGVDAPAALGTVAADVQPVAATEPESPPAATAAPDEAVTDTDEGDNADALDDILRIYCLQCKTHRAPLKPEYRTTTTGRRQIVGECPVCGNRLSKFAKSK